MVKIVSKKIFKLRKKLAISFIKILNNYNLDYIILGNKKNFLDKILTDIDIYINFHNKQNLEKIISKFLEKNKILLSNVIRHEHNSYNYTFAFKNKNEYDFFSIDICNDYVVNSRKLLSFSKKNSKSIIINNLKINFLSDDYMFYYILLKRIVKDDLNKENTSFLKKIFLKNKKKIINGEIFSSKVKIYLKFFFEKNKLGSKNLSKLIKTNYINKKKKNYPGEISRFIDRIFNKTGMHVVFLGTDGAGKSSLINLLQEKFEKDVSPFWFTEKYHLYSSSVEKKNKIAEPYKKPVYGKILSLVKIIFLYFAFLIFNFKNIFIKIRKSYLLINDRYFDDVFIDPSRYRVNGYQILVKIFLFLLPRPDLYFLIKASNKNIISRKKELTIKQINYNQKKYKNYAKLEKNVFVINTDKKKEISVNKIIEQILYKLNEDFKSLIHNL